MNRPEPSPLTPIQHPPDPAGFVATIVIDDTTPEPARPALVSRLVEGLIVVAIIGILVGLLLPAVQTPGRGGGATHSSRSEREARRLEIERALAEQEEYLRRTPVEENVVMAAPAESSRSK